jgi:hypothetical protein
MAGQLQDQMNPALKNKLEARTGLPPPMQSAVRSLIAKLAQRSCCLYFFICQKFILVEAIFARSMPSQIQNFPKFLLVSARTNYSYQRPNIGHQNVSAVAESSGILNKRKLQELLQQVWTCESSRQSSD